MDDTTGNTGSPYERTQEEVSWDAEFANMNDKRGSGYPRLLNDMTRAMTRVPGAVARMPMDVIPDETTMHARAAVREGFLAIRSLLSAIADGVEGMLGEPSGNKTTVSGPQGTWGSGRHSSSASSTPPGKARRIEVSDEVSERVGEGEGTVTIDELGDQEGRGLRADIDY